MRLLLKFSSVLKVVFWRLKLTCIKACIFLSSYIYVGSNYTSCPDYVFLVFAKSQMASKETPKKGYISFMSNIDPKSCRLCRSLGDSSHRTNLFKSTNQELLKIAEHLYGHALRKDPGLPSLVCRPCERRLKHAIDFRNVISKTQQDFEKSKTTEIRTKRLVDVSPSIQKPSKSRTIGTDTSARRTRMSLDFCSVEVDEEISTAMGDLRVQVCSFICSHRSFYFD